MAGRAYWNGYLKLSLVSCPVKLYSATSSSAGKISFNLLHKDTLNRVQQRYHDPELGEIDRADLVKGYQFEKDRYVVVTAEEGQDALFKLERIERPCLVLLDLLMPGMNGWEFYTKMRQLPNLDGVPVIVHSSASERAPAGVTQVIQKPITFDRLLAVVSKYCAAAPN